MLKSVFVPDLRRTRVFEFIIKEPQQITKKKKYNE